MNQAWLLTQFIFFLVVTGCLFFIPIIGGIWCWRNRGVNGKSAVITRTAAVLFAIAYEYASRVVAEGIGYKVRPVYKLAFGITYWQGQLVLAITVVWLVLYFLGRRR